MRNYRTILLSAFCGALLSTGALAQPSVPKNMNCTFDSCSAQIEGLTSLKINCGEKPVYNGAFEMTSDFQTTTIQADGEGAPLITIEGLPAKGAPAKATLNVSGESHAGSCGFEEVRK